MRRAGLGTCSLAHLLALVSSSSVRSSIWARPVRSKGEGREVPAHREGRPTMGQYLLSVHTVEGEVSDQMTHEEMQQSWKQIQVLEEELKSTGAWVFSGRLHDPDIATVLRTS